MFRSGTILIFFFTCSLYAWSAGRAIRERSSGPHFVLLANALVNGKVYLDEQPPDYREGDWTYFAGKWTVSFPPLPALLMVPFVAVWGKDFNDVIFTLLFGALNVALVYDLAPLIGRRLQQTFDMDEKTRVATAMLFGFGTVHWWVSVVGQVWFTAQIVSLSFLLLALREALGGKRPLWVGIWLALAGLGRPTMLLALPVFVWLLWPANPPRRLLAGLIPFGVVGVFMAWFNYTRFGNPFDLGYQYMLIEKLLEKPLKLGQFSLAHLGTNLRAAFWQLPSGWQPKWPFMTIDMFGLSMFFSTPALALVFAAPWREKLVQAAGLGAVLVAIPSLLYYNTGYMQAGYRFMLDFSPFLLVVVVAAMHGRLSKISGGLIALSLLAGAISLANFKIMSS